MNGFLQRIYALFEGVAIALDSLRSNRVRAGLTILELLIVWVVCVRFVSASQPMQQRPAGA